MIRACYIDGNRCVLGFARCGGGGARHVSNWLGSCWRRGGVGLGSKSLTARLQGRGQDRKEEPARGAAIIQGRQGARRGQLPPESGGRGGAQVCPGPLPPLPEGIWRGPTGPLGSRAACLPVLSGPGITAETSARTPGWARLWTGGYSPLPFLSRTHALGQSLLSLDERSEPRRTSSSEGICPFHWSWWDQGQVRACCSLGQTLEGPGEVPVRLPPVRQG